MFFQLQGQLEVQLERYESFFCWFPFSFEEVFGGCFFLFVLVGDAENNSEELEGSWISECCGWRSCGCSTHTNPCRSWPSALWLLPQRLIGKKETICNTRRIKFGSIFKHFCLFWSIQHGFHRIFSVEGALMNDDRSRRRLKSGNLST